MGVNEFQLRVNLGDADVAGIVYYPNYFKWFDMATHQYFRCLGKSLYYLEKEENTLLPLLDVHCSFHSPLYFEDIITIRSTMEEVKTKTIKIKHQVFRGDTLTGEGYELRCWTKKHDDTIEAEAIPDDMRELLLSELTNEHKQTNPWLA